MILDVFGRSSSDAENYLVRRLRHVRRPILGWFGQVRTLNRTPCRTASPSGFRVFLGGFSDADADGASSFVVRFPVLCVRRSVQRRKPHTDGRHLCTRTKPVSRTLRAGHPQTALFGVNIARAVRLCFNGWQNRVRFAFWFLRAPCSPRHLLPTYCLCYASRRCQQLSRMLSSG